MYYLYSYVQSFLILYISISAVFCIGSYRFCKLTDSASGWASFGFSFLSFHQSKALHIYYFDHFFVFAVVLVVYGRFLLVICWIIRGGTLFNNIIGICITISALSLMRAQSLKVIAVAFCLLFFYDIFWVFFSESFFGKNVMVTVAQQNFTEPVKASIRLFLLFDCSFCIVRSECQFFVSSWFPCMSLFGSLSLGETGAYDAGWSECVLFGVGRYLHSWTALRVSLYLWIFSEVLVVIFWWCYVEKRRQPLWMMWNPGVWLKWAIEREMRSQRTWSIRELVCTSRLVGVSERVRCSFLAVHSSPARKKLCHWCNYWKCVRTVLQLPCCYSV